MRKTATRTPDLREMLIQRRRDVQNQVNGRIRAGRNQRSSDVGDELDHADTHVQGDMDFTLLQMGADTLKRIDDALRRLDAGTYGRCFECGGPIAEQRLRALPFVVRCQACEVRREQLQGHAQRLALRRGRLSLFSDVTGA